VASRQAGVCRQLPTSGPGAGTDGRESSDDDVVELSGVLPDRWGHLFVDVSIEAGSYAYLSALVLVAE
jgi:hypothetical protein